MAEVNKSKIVAELIKHCLFTSQETDGFSQDEMKKKSILVDGIVTHWGFHPKRIEEVKPKVKWLLDQMPETFHKNGGGGWSFLQLCMDKDGQHWAEHKTMGELISLGIACGYASYCLPREAWEALPGGMPYVTFNTKGN